MTFIGRPQGLEALEVGDAYDVCIIGSGFSGSVLARELASKHARILLIESGTSLLRWVTDPDIKRLAAYTVSGNANYPTTKTKARALGGNSNFWTGRSERYHPSDFGPHPYVPVENPWPLMYADLEPYYERAERTLRVRGAKPSPYAQPRRADFPEPSTSNLENIRSLLEPAGVVLDDSPTATPSHAIRFFRLHKELIPEFSASPGVALVSGATVTRLKIDGDRRVTAAEVRTMDGAIWEARARLFVVACGGIETPRLMLLSRCDSAPEGIGNAFDRVGRGFNEHPGINMYAQIPHDRRTLAFRHQVGRSHQYYEEFRPDGLGSVLPVFIQSWVFPHHLIQPRLADLPVTVVRLARRLLRATIYIGATIEMVPQDGNRVTLSRERVDAFGNPIAHLHLDFSEKDTLTLDRTRQLIRRLFAKVGAADIEEAEVTWSRHHIGTCRMGGDPRHSVADPHLRVHGCPNLYLSGSETFVTGAAVPPVATIVALAHRLADHLTGRLANS